MAIPTRKENFSEWYQAVVSEGDMAELAHVRGCMVIKPWGWGIWEHIQQNLDKKIKETGHENAYFPLFIPLSYIQKEAKHVEGFAQEMAVVTHKRVENKDGKLVPAGKLDEPVIVRPTSETIIMESFKQWIQSYRDLPVLVNQWANVVRWEMRPRVFLRTVEFLWQEGHTAHATQAEAEAETEKMFQVYRDFAENYAALPVIPGEKPESERFPGAERTYTIEAMMQDGKALQAGTSHYLGQNFSSAAGIQFQNESGDLQTPHTTSWGVSTRLIGGVIMAHGDDQGLRIPPRIAPKQVVIVPILKDDDQDEVVNKYCQELAADVAKQSCFDGEVVRVEFDTGLHRSVDKKWKWIKRGAPLLLEIGGRDVADGAVTVYDRTSNDRETMSRDDFVKNIGKRLESIQETLFSDARKYLEENIHTDIEDHKAFEEHFQQDNPGFVQAYWCEDAASEDMLKPLNVTIRCLPLEQPEKEGVCVLTGKPASKVAIFAKAY
ncbi:MAG: proline--tRNA ligase [Patescibacteria group bacterium]